VTEKYSILSEHYFPFKAIYEGIHEEDKKKPLFSQTTKFKKFPNNLKGYKYQKIQRDNVKLFNPSIEETDKIKITINTHLNKITSDNFEKISALLTEELLKINHVQLFEILGNEIYFKCKNDEKYKHIYIQLFDHISKKLVGFKEYFVNFIQKQFYDKNVHLTGLTDEEEMIHKKNIFIVIEIIMLLIKNRIVKIDILHFVLINLLHLDNLALPLHEIELECVYILFKTLEKNAGLIQHQRRIFHEYYEKIEEARQLNPLFSKRTIFFIEQIKNIIRGIFPEDSVEKSNITSVKDVNHDFFQSIQEKNEVKLLQSYVTSKGSLFDTAMDSYFENKIPLGVMTKIIQIDIKENMSNFEMKMKKITENMEDILLDIPHALTKTKELLKDVEFPQKQEMFVYLDNIESS
jgi:hypothetical protein